MAKQELGLEITELTLGLPGATVEKKKRAFSDVISEEASSNGDQKRQKNKTQIVGWPPVRSYRKKNNRVLQEKAESGSAKRYVKVSKDGAAYLRKINLNSYKGYSDLGLGFEELFGALNDSENLEFVPIYEDKDGDWMLVGDVPWEMFIESCKRLRMMKKTEDSV